MKRNVVRLAVLVTVVLLLCTGLTQAAPTEPAPSVQSPSSAPTPTPPAPGHAGSGPASSPTRQAPSAARPTIPEVGPAAVTGPNAPAFNWNRSLRYLGNVLKPRGNDVVYNVAGNGGCVFVASGSDALQVWNVPLTLPEGTQVQWLRMFTYDTDPANAMTGYFTVYDAFGNAVAEWPVSSLDGGYMYNDVQITPPQTIDYSQFSYVIQWQATSKAIPTGSGDALQLCGFRVFYYQPVTSFMPFVSK